MIASTATLSDSGTSGSSPLRRRLHNHDRTGNEELNHGVVCSPATYQQFKIHPRSYYFVKADDFLEGTGDLFPSFIYK